MEKAIFLSKEELHPRFGYALPPNRRVFIKGDLPRCVRAFVSAHELCHLQDRANWWVWREFKANIAGALKHPVGFIFCILISLAPYGLKYYWERIIGRVS